MTIVTPPHEHYQPSHLASVIVKMRALGAPRIRAHYDRESGAWMAMEGTHRLRAALALGVAPVVVPVPWPRGRRALERARFAAALRGHVFPRVEVDRG